MDGLPIITGMAITSNPDFVRILLDSEIKLDKGLKCWADSNAKTRSMELLANGSFVDVELIGSMFFCFPDKTNCLKLILTQYKQRLEKISHNSLDGAERPLPTSTTFFPEDNSAKSPKITHRLFWAEIGSVCFEDQQPKFSIDPPVASCITGERVA